MPLRTSFAPLGDHVDDHSIIHAVLNTVYNVRDPQFGAHGDGENDDTAEIQAAIDTAYAAGGGLVHIPAGIYKTSTPLYLYDNVQIVGDGYASQINNVCESGFDKCAIVAGNIGSPDDITGVYHETYYPITQTERGAYSINLTTAEHSDAFTTGDVVFLKSTQTFADNGRPYYVFTNIVVSAADGVLVLKYACPDAYDAIARLTGDLNGYDGNPHYMPKRVGVSNIRISNVVNGVSGWYGLFLSCLESDFYNIWFDEVSKGIGSNCASFNSFRNLWINFYAAPIDLAYLSCGNNLSSIWALKTTGTTELGDLGIALHEEGCDNHVTDFYIDMKGAGTVSGISNWHNHRGTFNRGVVLNAGGIGALINPSSEYCEIESVNIINSGAHGIYIGGYYGRVTNCTIVGVGEDSHAIRIALGAATDYIVTGNVLGRSGERDAKDVVYDPNSLGVVSGNITY